MTHVQINILPFDGFASDDNHLLRERARRELVQLEEQKTRKRQVINYAHVSFDEFIIFHLPKC